MAVAIAAAFTRPRVRRWMRQHVAEHVDARTGEVNCTQLAEEAADYFEQYDVDGPIDDPDHWIWEVAAEVGDPDSGDAAWAPAQETR